ncbi:hypothetical protein [Legionella israelensis]|uniref:hypothetical protein n=1 Tax=Legionella israelensis TaxID=454 RepID=UPI000731DCD6|nr:hypothetical protein [Legionella israelensis]QBS10436.1 hypothetical protein E4T55_11550 [Legionella israelensis]
MIKVKFLFPVEKQEVITHYQIDIFTETKKRTEALELAAKQIPEFKKFIFNANESLIKEFTFEIIKLRKDKIYLKNRRITTPKFIESYIENKGHVFLSQEQRQALNNLKERRYGSSDKSAKSYNEIVQTPLFKM